MYVFIGEHVALAYLIRALANKGAFDNGEYIIISIDDKLNVSGKFFDVGKFDFCGMTTDYRITFRRNK